MDNQTIFLLILGIVFVVFFLTSCKPKPVIPNPPGPDPVIPDPSPTPIPDPAYHKWQLVKTDTSRWAEYFAYMQKIKSDSLMALEMIKKINGERFYVWTAEAGDYWDLPDEVWEKGKVDCDGFARLTSDGLARFAKYPEVFWMEYYGYYRDYTFTALERAKVLLGRVVGLKTNLDYVIRLAGHAITVYKKDGKLLAFSNTEWWWNKNFEDFVSIGEETFPEGIVLIRCRHWETGILHWVQEAPEDGILEGSNIFDRHKEVGAKKFDSKKLVI